MRVATVEDIPALVEMGRRFHAASHWNGQVGYDPQSADRSLKHHLAQPTTRVFLTEVEGRITGFIATLLLPLYFNLSSFIAMELDWYSEDPRTAFRLLKTATEDAKKQGAVLFHLGAQHGPQTDRFARVYERLGFKPFSHTYSKEL